MYSIGFVGEPIVSISVKGTISTQAYHYVWSLSLDHHEFTLWSRVYMSDVVMCVVRVCVVYVYEWQ